jgi:hypothetical protein
VTERLALYDEARRSQAERHDQAEAERVGHLVRLDAEPRRIVPRGQAGGERQARGTEHRERRAASEPERKEALQDLRCSRRIRPIVTLYVATVAMPDASPGSRRSPPPARAGSFFRSIRPRSLRDE